MSVEHPPQKLGPAKPRRAANLSGCLRARLAIGVRFSARCGNRAHRHDSRAIWTQLNTYRTNAQIEDGGVCDPIVQ